MDKTNCFKNPEKRKAYETVLQLAERLTNTQLYTQFDALAAPVLQAHSTLTRQDARQVAAKAIRVERGRRH